MNAKRNLNEPDVALNHGERAQHWAPQEHVSSGADVWICGALRTPTERSDIPAPLEFARVSTGFFEAHCVGLISLKALDVAYAGCANVTNEPWFAAHES
jgi:hypothetical protein